MTILKSRMREAVDVLKAAGLTDVSDVLRSIVENKDNETNKIELVDTNAFVASILLSNEDIEIALKEEGYEVNEENIRSVREYLDCTGRSLSEIIEEESDTGFYTIRNAITELAMDLEQAGKEMVD